MIIALVGNGILGLQTAYRLLKDDPQLKLIVIGPTDHPGCASLAAAAMLNSFCEVETSTLKNPIERQKFLFNKSSNSLWPELLKEIESRSGVRLEYGFGTFLINNSASDRLEDLNFDAILQALKEFNEPYETIECRDIPQYKPASAKRAGRAICVTREGWLNPILLFQALKEILQKSGRVQFVNGVCSRMVLDKSQQHVESVELSTTDRIVADQFLLCPGANFTRIVENSNLGDHFMKIFYGVGSTLLLKTGENTLKKCIRTPNRGLACGIYSAPQNESHTIIGASNFIAPEAVNHPRVTSVYTLLKSAMEQINSDFYRSELVKVNVGWRPTSADTLPLIGATSISNLAVATGTKRDGLHCSPVISEYLSDILLKRKSKHDLSLFKPERKMVRVYTREEAIKMAVTHTLNAAYQHDFEPPKNRMLDDLEAYYTQQFTDLHEKIGARTWGIPPEMLDMYKYGHIKNLS